MFAPPTSPAISPAVIKPPQPVSDTAPPPLLVLAPPPFVSPPSSLSAAAPPAPPVTSPAASAPRTMSSTAPTPTNSPMTSVPPLSSSPSPKTLLVPASSPPIVSDDSPDSPMPSSPPSPATISPPAMPLPSPVASASQPPPPFPFATAPAIARTPFPIPPSAPAPPTTTFPPPPPALPKAMSPVPEITSSPPPGTPLALNIYPPPLPTPLTKLPPFPLSSRAAPSPSSPTMSESAPEVVKFPPPPSSSTGNLPVAVEVQKPPTFNVSSTGLIVGLVIGAIIFVTVLAIVSVLCAGCYRDRKRKKKKHNLYPHHHNEHEESSPCVGSKGSHVIQVLSNPTLPPYPSEGGGASGFVNSGSAKAIPNHAPSPSIAFGPSVYGTFTYEELAVATNCFSKANLLGQGGFGYVYKGVLPCGKEIAVKQLKTGSQQGEREFRAEVETISRVHHKHLVELVGYCITGAERLLVYEYVPNNTLEFHLHGEGQPVIEWATRIRIALGSAKGLAYLHQDCNPAIIHRDIKASNILLDFKFEAKVSDFGLAKIFPNTDSCITHLTTRVVGTFGYLAPEYASSGKLTDKSDVYSYGVMLLELITGRPPINTAESSRNQSLVDWARPLLAQALEDGDFRSLVDPRLQRNYVADEMARMITCAAACVRHSARLRPRMSQIVGALEGLVSLSDLVGDITPGHTRLYSWSESSNYDASQYQQDIRNFNLALKCQRYSFSEDSESTSAYGLHPSGSSSEVQQS